MKAYETRGTEVEMQEYAKNVVTVYAHWLWRRLRVDKSAYRTELQENTKYEFELEHEFAFLW